jgi:phage FluMu protein Com
MGGVVCDECGSVMAVIDLTCNEDGYTLEIKCPRCGKRQILQEFVNSGEVRQ